MEGERGETAGQPGDNELRMLLAEAKAQYVVQPADYLEGDAVTLMGLLKLDRGWCDDGAQQRHAAGKSAPQRAGDTTDPPIPIVLTAGRDGTAQLR